MKRFNRGPLKIWGLKAKTWATMIILVELIIIIMTVGSYANSRIKVAEAQGFAQALPKVEKPLPPDSEYNQIHNYIREVFGEHATDAFKVLEGRGECRGENGGLNPFAVNTNWSKVPGVADSKDYGIFQINNKWQGVTNTAFLFDWRTNINMAWVIYKNSGYNFHLWTGGSCQGI